MTEDRSPPEPGKTSASADLSEREARRRALGRLWTFARRHRRRWAFGFVMLLLTNATTMAIPQFIRMAVDGIEAGETVGFLAGVAMLMVLVASGGAVFRALSRIHIFYAGRDVELDLRTRFFRHLSTLSPSYYQDQQTGDLMSRATSDLTQIRLLLGPGILNIVNTSIAYLTAVPLMMLISVRLTLITLAVYPAGLMLMRYLSSVLYQRNRAQQQAMGTLSDLAQETLAGFR